MRGVVMAGLMAAAAPGAAGAQAGWDWSGHPMWWMWGAGGLIMMLVMIAFWGAVIVGLVLGIRWLLGQADGRRRDRALEILRERYARGEIDRQEFEARRRDLTA